MSQISRCKPLGDFTLGQGTTFSQNGQIIVTSDGDDLLVQGNVDGNNDDAEFTIRVSGKSELDGGDFGL